MQIRTLEPKRVREAATVLADAFTDEPIISRMIPLGTIHRQRKIADYFVWSMRLTGLNTIDVAADPLSGKLLGVALWEPPGHASRWIAGLPAKPGVLRGIGRRGLRVLDEYEAAGAGKHPQEPHWHLVDVGTSAAARGLGVGTKLIEHRLSIVDHTGCPASLEATTARSAQLYERLGFEHQHTLTGVAEGVSVMWRLPSTERGKLAA